jgi:hypothetical protein
MNVVSPYNTCHRIAAGTDMQPRRKEHAGGLNAKTDYLIFREMSSTSSANIWEHERDAQSISTTRIRREITRGYYESCTWFDWDERSVVLALPAASVSWRRWRWQLMDKAIVVNAPNEDEGEAEYDWLAAKFGPRNYAWKMVASTTERRRCTTSWEVEAWRDVGGWKTGYRVFFLISPLPMASLIWYEFRAQYIAPLRCFFPITSTLSHPNSSENPSLMTI